jgi:outer membrane protein insertion porin family/translocation and assembly module TamA
VPAPRHTGLAVSLALLAFPGSALQAQVALPLGPEVRAVDFVGNSSFPSDSLARAIVTTQTRCRSRALFWLCWLGFAQRRGELLDVEIGRDAARLEIWYQRRGFREVDVEGASTLGPDGRAEVVFTVTEGQAVIADSISYVGADAFAGTDLLDELPIQQGDRWSSLRLDATRDTLVRRLNNRGYPYADVLRQTVFPAGEPYHAHVTFEIEAGTRAVYGDIRVLGIDHLSESTILRTLPFRSGDPYRIGQLVDAQTRLFGLDLVTSASITPDLSSPSDPTVALLVQVQEGDPYRVRAGVGWSRSECLNAESRWTSRNFLGGGRVLQVRGRLANILAQELNDPKAAASALWRRACNQAGEDDYADMTWLGAVDFSQPWIFSTRNRFNASLFVERQSVPDVFVRKAFGLQLAIVRAVGPQTPLTLSYRPELSSLDAAEYLLCTGFLVCTRQDIAVLTSAQRLAPIGLNLTRDLSNSLLNPTRGYRLIVDLEHASGWTGSEFRYDRAVVEGTWYSGLFGPAVLATRIRGGWVGSGGEEGTRDIIPPQKRYYAGGANSVRGFAQGRLGPRVLVAATEALVDSLSGPCTVPEVIDLTCDATGIRLDSRPTGGTRVLEGNAEIRIALGTDLEAVTFMDFGQVWADGQRVELDALEFTPGVGLRYLSPVGPLRVDLGYTFQADERLSVVTTRIEASAQPPGYVKTRDLAVLDPRVSFRSTESRFQLQISIGQAF